MGVLQLSTAMPVPDVAASAAEAARALDSGADGVVILASNCARSGPGLHERQDNPVEDYVETQGAAEPPYRDGTPAQKMTCIGLLGS